MSKTVRKGGKQNRYEEIRKRRNEIDRKERRFIKQRGLLIPAGACL